MSHPFSTTSRTVLGTAALTALIHNLCHASVWFEVTPEPDDYFTVTVKADTPASLLYPTNTQAQRYYAIHTSAYGIQVESFETAEARDTWAEEQDDSYADFFAIDSTGHLTDAYILATGPQN